MDIINFRVSPDGKNLELWVEIPEGSGYEDLKIDKIAIQNHLNYSTSYPSKPQIELTPTQIEPFNIDNPKQVVKILPLKDLKLVGNLENTGLFFMYVHQTGIPGPELECSCTKETTIAIAANLYPIYNKAIKLFSQMNGECKDSSFRDGLVDIAWKKDMFKQAVILQEYSTAIEIFNDLLFYDIKEGDYLNTCSNSNYNKLPNVVSTGGCRTCR